MVASRYEQLIDSVVNGVYVSNYERIKKVSKTGNSYTQGRLTVAYETSKHITLDISISSWNKWSFVRNLDKLNGVDSSSKKQTNSTKQEKQQKTTSSKTTKTKAQEKLEETYNSWYKNYSTFYENNFKSQVRMYVEDLYNEDKLDKLNMQNIVQDILTRWYRFYRDMPAGDYTCKSKSANDRRRMQNKANEDAWKNVRCEQRIFEVFQEALQKLKEKLEEQKRWREQYKRQQFEERMRYEYGENWEEAWQRENFGETKTDAKDNEFTVEFKGCKTVKEVKAVYRRLAKLHHSDAGGNDEKFKLVHEAYETAMKKVA